MARTRLADQLRESASVARESFERGVEVDQVLEGRRTRRELLRDAGLLALGVSALGRLTDVARAAPASARVVVVGAGLAGLTAAYRLKQAGCIAAPQTIMNAVLDALAPLGIHELDMPATPYLVWSAIQAARATRPT